MVEGGRRRPRRRARPGRSRNFSTAPQFYTLYTALIAIGAGMVLIPRLPLVPVMFLSQVANGMVLPLVLYYIVKLANREDLMGELVNSQAVSGALWATAGLMTVLTVVALGNLFGLW
jgi:Mn2+/Fe2+ NRAMP family transporter